MQISKDDSQNPFRIQSYEPGKIVINDHAFTISLIISKTALQTDWPPQRFADLTMAHFDALLTYPVKLVIFGTGPTQQFPHPSLYSNLLRQGVAIEFMHSKAACHTFNILLSENRDVICVLLP